MDQHQAKLPVPAHPLDTYTWDELITMHKFYQEGPPGNTQCQATLDMIEAELVTRAIKSQPQPQTSTK